MAPGININLISMEKLTELSSEEKIRFILDEIKHGNVLVLERGLTATEEAELIKTTMLNIDQDTFIGIEMQSYSKEDVKKGSWLSKLLRRRQQPRMSVIGPADLLKTIHKDGNMIQAMILTHDTIIGEERGSKKEVTTAQEKPEISEGQSVEHDLETKPLPPNDHVSTPHPNEDPVHYKEHTEEG